MKILIASTLGTAHVTFLKDSKFFKRVGGDVLDIPGGIKHAWRNVSGAPVSFLVETTITMGRFRRDIGRPVATVKPGRPYPADFERLFDMARAYGYWIGNPAENAAVGTSLGGHCGDNHA